MDPAALALIAMLTAGAFGILAALYVTMPYPPMIQGKIKLPSFPNSAASFSRRLLLGTSGLGRRRFPRRWCRCLSTRDAVKNFITVS